MQSSGAHLTVVDQKPKREQIRIGPLAPAQPPRVEHRTDAECGKLFHAMLKDALDG